MPEPQGNEPAELNKDVAHDNMKGTKAGTAASRMDQTSGKVSTSPLPIRSRPASPGGKG